MPTTSLLLVPRRPLLLPREPLLLVPVPIPMLLLMCGGRRCSCRQRHYYCAANAATIVPLLLCHQRRYYCAANAAAARAKDAATAVAEDAAAFAEYPGVGVEDAAACAGLCSCRGPSPITGDGDGFASSLVVVLVRHDL